MKSGFVYSKFIGSKYSMKAIKSIDLEKKTLTAIYCKSDRLI